MTARADQPLAGVRVADFSKVLAGPLCTQYLADMGAEVIKIEAVQTGDDTRGWPPFAAPGMGAVFLSANRGKRSIALDLKSEAGRAAAHKIVAGCDVAIESFGTGVAERLAIDEDSLRAVSPDLVYCSISGFGRTGPMASAPGYDVILQAYCGVMALTGEEGGDYVRSPISPIDQVTGMHALTGILAALYARRGGAGGRRIDVNLFETALGLMHYNLQSYWIKGSQPTRCGSSHEALCPYQAFEAKDGPLMIGVANDSLWRKFCGVAGLEDIRDDPRFATNAARVENRAATIARVQTALAERPIDHWIDALSAIRVPCAPINDLDSLMTAAQTKASGAVMELDDIVPEARRSVAQPVTFDRLPHHPGRRPPHHGEHGVAILEEVGLSRKEIEDLLKDHALVLPQAETPADT